MVVTQSHSGIILRLPVMVHATLKKAYPFMKVDYLKVLMKNSEPYSLGQYLVPQEHCGRGSAPDPSTNLHFDGGHRTLGRM